MDTEINNLLKARGYSITPSRRKLYSLLRNSPPMEISILVDSMGGFNRATVYRNIGLFEKLGAIHRLRSGESYKLELAGPYHKHPHHMACLLCGINIPLPYDKKLDGDIFRLASSHGFSTQESYLEITGRCANC